MLCLRIFVKALELLGELLNSAGSDFEFQTFIISANQNLLIKPPSSSNVLL